MAALPRKNRGSPQAGIPTPSTVCISEAPPGILLCANAYHQRQGEAKGEAAGEDPMRGLLHLPLAENLLKLQSERD